ncbi:response regulator [Zobellia uliginosa]|uniref:response regulator n=1 Tax=Zobellia uliginosa TaxID=143224 RepID=UPI001C07898F|nr:response regulator [Zobellia uliginosa]MBU2946631.1 response regulator [Zobellia uliginosa]
MNSILLVDDDEINNILHSVFINKLDLDIEVNTVVNGQEAIDFILSEKEDELVLPCMVMLDLKMPVMNGWEFMKAYEDLVPKELKDQITIVLVTTSDDQEDRDKAMINEFVDDFSQKPLSDETFKQLIQNNFNLTAI